VHTCDGAAMHAQPSRGLAGLHTLVLVEGNGAVEQAAGGAVQKAQPVDGVAQEVAAPRGQRRPQIPHLHPHPSLGASSRHAPPPVAWHLRACTHTTRSLRTPPGMPCMLLHSSRHARPSNMHPHALCTHKQVSSPTLQVACSAALLVEGCWQLGCTASCRAAGMCGHTFAQQHVWRMGARHGMHAQ
jgi:hypothetical protein